MENPTMLYRCPGSETFEGVSCETTIVDEAEVEAHLEEGWRRDWVQADEARKEVAAKLAANEAEQRRIEAELAKSDKGGKKDGDAGDAPKLQAVHKGRGKFDVVDAAGTVLVSGLTRADAEARAKAGS